VVGWSADGGSLLVTRDGHVRRLAIGAAADDDLGACAAPALSHARRLLACATGADLTVAALGGDGRPSGAAKVALGVKAVAGVRPAFAPGDTTLAAVLAGTGDQGRLVRVPASGGAATQLATTTTAATLTW
jgi:hypothetical protein